MNLTFSVSFKHLQTIGNLTTNKIKGLVPNKKTIHNSIYYMPINQTYYSQVKTNTRSHPSPEDTNGLKTWEFRLELNVGPREREQWLLPIGVFSCRKTKN